MSTENNNGHKKMAEKSSFYQVFYKIVTFVGFEVLKVVQNIFITERQLSKALAKKLTRPLELLCAGVISAARRIAFEIGRPFRKIASGIRQIHKNVSDARKIDRRLAVKAFFDTFLSGMRRNKWFAKTLLNYLAPVVGVAVLVITVQLTSQVYFALEVQYNGSLLGYVEDENVYARAEKMFDDRLVFDGSEEEAIDVSLQFKLHAVEKQEVLTEDELVDKMIRLSSKDVVEASGVYIDGSFYGAVEDPAPIQATVEKVLDAHRTGKANETVSLVKPVEMKEGLYLTDTLVDPEEIVTLLNSEVAGEITYTVQKGETPSGVAKKNGITYSDFKAMNPDCEKKFFIGQKVYIAKSEPFLAVKVTRRETRKAETMYKSEETRDNSKSISYRKVTQKGVKGITELTEDIEYINGVETARTQVSAKVLQKLVNEKVTVGTKVAYSGGNKPQSSVGNGNLGNLHFRYPLSSFRQSRGFSGGHGGLDLCAPRNTPIYASEKGTVVLASNRYFTYGKCVIVDHGNGWQTLYAHCNSLNVKVGQSVSKGQVIAYVGSTGRSTGNHCHFEIRKNSRRVNPASYVNR